MEGRILAADHHGAYALKLVGDVRVNLCSSIDEYVEHMFQDPEFQSVLVDLFKPVIYSCRMGINRLLQSMAFGRLFDIRQESFVNGSVIKEIPAVNDEPDVVREKVIEAHRALMDVSEENRDRFTDLVTALEKGA